MAEREHRNIGKGRPTTPEGAVILTPVEARGAVKTGVMRYVLAVSTAAAIVALLVAWLFLRPKAAPTRYSRRACSRAVRGLDYHDRHGSPLSEQKRSGNRRYLADSGQRRIVTTHTGSLPRPEKSVGAAVREMPRRCGELARQAREAVAAIVAKQIDLGIDVVSDGEQSKVELLRSIRLKRLSGIESHHPEIGRTPDPRERGVSELLPRRRASRLGPGALRLHRPDRLYRDQRC